MSLAHKAAIVTGGSKGIGRAIAAALLDSGAHVLITGRDAAKAAQSAISEAKAAFAADTAKRATRVWSQINNK